MAVAIRAEAGIAPRKRSAPLTVRTRLDVIAKRPTTCSQIGRGAAFRSSAICIAIASEWKRAWAGRYAVHGHPRCATGPKGDVLRCGERCPPCRYVITRWVLGVQRLILRAVLGGVRPLGFWQYGPYRSTSRAAIRDAIVSKSGRYGMLDRPFIIAVNAGPPQWREVCPRRWSGLSGKGVEGLRH